MVDLLPLQLGIPGGPELLVILLIAVLLFGANKIPQLARSTGEAMGEFQKGREEVEQELQQMRDGATSTESGGPDATAESTTETTATETSGTETTGAETTSTSGSDENVDIADAETEDETR